LVVEEALNNGTPVIVSDRVGCKDDLVTKETGIVFSLKSGAEGLRSAILKTQNLTFYNALRKGVSKLDFKERARTQVRTFVEQDN
jgi:glycosyltransferase involved in cell wall biosynthesis